MEMGSKVFELCKIDKKDEGADKHFDDNDVAQYAKILEGHNKTGSLQSLTLT
jgi:hypothetical protein